MGLEGLKDVIKDYAKDIRLNLGSVLDESGAPGLTGKQILAIALASAYATKTSALIAALEAANAKLEDREIAAAKSAATLMAMNNVYYRTLHLLNDPEIAKLPAKLRMNVIANPGVPKLDFELMCLAVSAMSGCGACISAHVNEVRRAGVDNLGIQSVIRIAAVIQATAQALAIN